MQVDALKMRFEVLESLVGGLMKFERHQECMGPKPFNVKLQITSSLHTESFKRNRNESLPPLRQVEASDSQSSFVSQSMVAL